MFKAHLKESTASVAQLGRTKIAYLLSVIQKVILKSKSVSIIIYNKEK
jgi:hypothetical protein